MAEEEEEPLSGLIPGLPDDIAVRCISRVPRPHHPTLAHVSRSWRSLLRSPLFSALRSSLRTAEPLLLLSLRGPSNYSRWLLLHPPLRAPPQPLPSPPLPTLGSACAAAGPAVYLLGGSLDGIPSTAFQILDARRPSWSLGPRMLAAREFAAAAAIGGKIYSVGGCAPIYDFWAEALDLAAGPAAWAPVPSPARIRDKWMHGTCVLGGRLLAVADRGGLVYDPAAGAWGPVPKALDMGWRGRAAVVGGVLYSYDFLGKIRGYDPEADKWRRVEGVDGELPKFLHGAALADLGGTLCVLWERRRSRKDTMEIEIAGIGITRTGCRGLRGTILWREAVDLDAPKWSTIAHCVSLEL